MAVSRDHSTTRVRDYDDARGSRGDTPSASSSSRHRPDADVTRNDNSSWVETGTSWIRRAASSAPLWAWLVLVLAVITVVAVWSARTSARALQAAASRTYAGATTPADTSTRTTTPGRAPSSLAGAAASVPAAPPLRALAAAAGTPPLAASGNGGATSPASTASASTTPALPLASASASGGSGAATALRATDVPSACRLLVQKAAEWASISAQDTEPLLALMHAMQAVGYVNVARELADDAALHALFPGLYMPDFVKEIVKTQRAAVTRMVSQNPGAAPSSAVAMHTTWLRP